MKTTTPTITNYFQTSSIHPNRFLGFDGETSSSMIMLINFAVGLLVLVLALTLRCVQNVQ